MLKIDNESIFSPIDGNWDLRTQFPIVVSSINDNGTINGHFDFKNMSGTKKILALTI